MTEGDLLEHIFERLCRADAGEEIFGGDEAAEWAAGVLDVLTEAGLLRPAPPAQVVECDGCDLAAKTPCDDVKAHEPARSRKVRNVPDIVAVDTT
jgi:hypothetical protein